MTAGIRRELLVERPCEAVWQAIADRDALAEWMYPNDFEPRIGHRFTFRVPGNPQVGFDGLTVQCEVLECDPPRKLVFSWTVGGPVVDTRVSFRLEPEGDGTRIFFEHAGFDDSQPFGKQALYGAEYGWAQMLDRLVDLVASDTSR